MIFMIFFQVKIYGFLFGFDSFITTDFFSTDKTGSSQRIVCFEHWLHSHRLVVSEVGFLFDLKEKLHFLYITKVFPFFKNKTLIPHLDLGPDQVVRLRPLDLDPPPFLA